MMGRMVSLALLTLLLHAAPSGAPPVPSDCRAEETQELTRKVHFPLFYVDARCAGEEVAYLCTDTRCLKNPCGGAEGMVPRLLQIKGASRSHAKRSGRSRGSHAKKSKSKAKSEAPPSGAWGEALALLLRGPEDALQVVTLSAKAGQPGCRPFSGLEQVLVEATNKRVKIGERLGRSGVRDQLKGHSVVLTRGLYVGGDVPGGPSHGYLQIRAKLSGKKLKFSSATRKSADAIRFGAK